MKCPKCSSTELRKSRHGSWADAMHKLMGRHAYRCRSCRARFHSAESLEASTPASRDSGTPRHQHKNRHLGKTLRRRLLEVAVFVVMLVIFLVFLRYLTREQSPASEPQSGSIRPTIGASHYS